MAEYRPNDEARGQDARLDALFRAYREACPEPEASANFMPMLWQKIEARRSGPLLFGRLSRAFVTCAAALSLVMGTYITIHSQNSVFPGAVFSGESYVEALSVDHAPDAMTYNGPDTDQDEEI